MKMKEHVTLVAALHIGLGAIVLLLALFIFVVVVGSGLISGDETAIAVTAIVGSVVAGFLLILALPGIVGGIGLLRYHEWARILVMVVSAFQLFDIPVGTAIGVYSFWALTQPEVVELFRSRPPAPAQ
jgi:hypothetical protein